MGFKPLIVDVGHIKQLPSGQALDAGGWVFPTSPGTVDYILIADSGGDAVWTEPSFGHKIPAPTADNQVYNSTGVGTAAWTGDPRVDTLELDGYLSNFLGASNYRVHHDIFGWYYNGTTTGTLKITYPVGYNSVRHVLKILGRDIANGDHNWELIFGGSNESSGGWSWFSADVIGNPPFSSVRVAYDGSNVCLLLGTLTTDWYYPQITITDLFATPSNLDSMRTGWSASILATESGLSDIETVPVARFDNFGYNLDAPTATDKVLVSTGNTTAAWYSSCLATAIKTAESASNEDKVLIADSAGDFQLANPKWPRMLTTNETVYVRTTGNDTTGDGSSGSPYATVGKALSHIGDLWAGPYTITVDVGEGQFSENQLTFQYPYGASVTVAGVSESHSSVSCSNYDTSTTAGPSGLQYYEFDVTLPVGYSCSVGDYIMVKSPSGGSNPDSIRGGHKVTAYNAGTRVATLKVWQRTSSSYLPSGSITCDLTVLKTILQFTGTAIRVDGAFHGGKWDEIAFEGTYDSGNGIWMLNGGSIWIGPDACLSGFAKCYMAQNCGLIFADGTMIEYASTYGVHAQNNSTVNMRSSTTAAVIGGIKSTGAYLQNQSTLAMSSSYAICSGYTGLFCADSSWIDFGSSKVLYIPGTGLYAESGGGIDATGGATTGCTTSKDPASNPGNNEAFIIGP